MSSTRLLVAAWLTVHRAGQVLIGVIVTATVFALGADLMIQTWGAQRYLPLWALAPPTIGLVCVVGIENRLGWALPARPTPLRGARLLWLTALAGVGGCAALPVSHVVGDGSIVLVTVLIVLGAAACAPVHVHLPLLFCTVLDAVAVVFASDPGVDAPMRAALAAIPEELWATVGIVVPTGVAVHLFRH